MHRVQDEMYQPLAQVIHTAVEALNLDVDLMVASSLRTGGAPAPRDAVRAAIDALLETVNTYTSEIAQQQRPTLRGFLTYLDMANGSDMPEAAADLGDEPADVVLMTVHQSKGLEWDAVAIVGMQQGAFPSNKGDALRVKALEDRGSKLDWEPPLYEETAKSWLESPEAVPVPIRVDAAILPKFPTIPDAGGSDASSLQESAVRALRDIDSVESLENDAYGELRALLRDNGVLLDELGEPDAWNLSQKEERGRALHADERAPHVCGVDPRQARCIGHLQRGRHDEPHTGRQRQGVGRPLRVLAGIARFHVMRRLVLPACGTDRVRQSDHRAGPAGCRHCRQHRRDLR